jgi:hypothetical protein
MMMTMMMMMSVVESMDAVAVDKSIVAQDDTSMFDQGIRNDSK